MKKFPHAVLVRFTHRLTHTPEHALNHLRDGSLARLIEGELNKLWPSKPTATVLLTPHALSIHAGRALHARNPTGMTPVQISAVHELCRQILNHAQLAQARLEALQKNFPVGTVVRYVNTASHHHGCTGIVWKHARYRVTLRLHSRGWWVYPKISSSRCLEKLSTAEVR